MVHQLELIPQSSNDYDRIAQAIAFIRQHHRQQPDLATIAQHVHLSEHHFQRLFTRWAGISPKRFVQYLTVEYAKSTIAHSKSLLDVTLAAGLSSPGRLHDLFVNVEGMSPGEYKAGGAGLEIYYGLHSTPFGTALIALTERGICSLKFLEDFDRSIGEQQLRQEWPKASLVEDLAGTQAACDRIFSPTPPSSPTPPPPLTVLLKGTNFQLQVWRALLSIPTGHLATYQAIATAIGRPTAARAVGTAIGSNTIAYLIPCHRVLRESGELGGYRWGCDRKAAILGWEASRQNLQSD
ncbi:methylated-DNA--[protein]-cysteine S-methyltransferase [Pseudanabaena sp. FACHB-2040]|uniref:bifunctional transcriptional activator/DNA repair enzyme AdaA n=1 Tax=Pseudanabaena sp. FACHB-2040 TaxID=2692859 RepID=UPI00168617E5|nr:methylated-DNA--[protein]-cysteine S-methyltransferase [Pseudanabaena sp. FACHB-2040]MBD2260862.1 methylated-DNA--[protein]-cysteine S-methyltransferase [Pseudanabaena sp. FACHB-2040]